VYAITIKRKMENNIKVDFKRLVLRRGSRLNWLRIVSNGFDIDNG
jgi:hypothetical protein